ncbi:MAG TPA: LysR substrate-binding domain-containing protein [Polyangia bacterium]|jgi:LysR family hydrogen peroxide-inducible transcriptional activator|nr:LysR substrate-binding domain-containing protein [Polyangia bacterium]
MNTPRRPPPLFTLRQLQYAVAVADTLSFRRAAETCGVSQPSLSAQLGELEEALGARLFERDRRRVLLTAAGETLVARARHVLTDAEDLADAGRRLVDPLAGTLRVGVIPTISSYLLPDVVRALRRGHARLDVRWTEDKTSALVGALEEGTLDAALVALEANLGQLAREPLGRDPFLLAAPRGHALARRTGAVTAEELVGAPLLLLDDGHCLRDQALAACGGARPEELGFRATSLPTLAQMVAAGAGVTLLPALAVPTESRRAPLVVRPLADPAAFRTVGLVWRPTSPLAPALRAVAATLRAAYPLPAKPARRRARQTPRSSSARDARQ